MDRSPVPRRFEPRDYVGGRLCLDFVNTITARDTAPRDRLGDCAALLAWAAASGAFETTDLRHLTRLARASPALAASALGRARRAREVLERCLHAAARGRPPSPADAAALDHALHRAAAAAQWQTRQGRLSPRWAVERSALDLVLHRVLADAALLLHLATPRLRQCAGPACGWWFLDESKSGRRRWCDMRTCGNVAKARRFRRRRQPPVQS